MPFSDSLDSPVACPGATQEAVVLAPLPEVVAAIATGRPVLVLDDADRENEADLVCAAANMSEATMALMIREGSGIVCLCLTPGHARALGLRPMVEVNRSAFSTAFTQSIEAAHGVSTGVSAADRLQTVRCALRIPAPGAAPEVVSPGHVFPLVARPGGVLERSGHTESAVDLAVLAGLPPAGVLCELMNPDGSMARGTQVARFAQAHGLLCTTVRALADYRRTQA
ncbi:3,4-dihydroxy-2-butanone-4-phosphate synthase [Simplicispira lacusdiani]|uniref:3,4-dihydroxy-2-butanone-4-phosphate synthase n=1 Tax=Simplicispira lacusdiani TaxID=2213010 RepID=UPI001E566DBC|nr:3,4-dihydroxy-2-butanone-4-phosphate synthase [Simplicispira lacusdiani]